MSTKIEWTDETWNPIRGCSRVSEGCRNCYAEKVAYRFSGPGQPYEGLVQVAQFDHSVPGMEVKTERRLPLWNGKIKFVEEHLLDPLRWKTPRRIFVNSMSDLFHPNVTDEMRYKIYAVMALCPHHTFQVLTKRPELMLPFCKKLGRHHEVDGVSLAMKQIDSKRGAMYSLTEKGWAFPNIHLGVSVENAAAKHRIDTLRDVPAALRFLSLEPLLGDLGDVNLDGIGWVIVGGESGPGARPMHPDWARSLRDQCVVAGVPFFFKQHGEWISLCDYNPFVHGQNPDGYKHEFAWRTGQKNAAELPISCFRVGKKAAGHLLDGKEWHQFPEVRA